ncbi:MAG: hemolysin III family protein [Clostridiales bacterium]
MNNILPGSFFTVAEEIANAITHGIGAALAIAGTVVMIVTAAMTGDPWKIVSVSIYGATLILLFLMSTLYHALVPEKAKRVFRVFDHSSIFLLIAGSYIPYTLVTLRGPLGWTIFGLVWALAIVGVVLNCISIERFEKFSLAAYLGMGWCIVIAIVPLIRLLPAGGLAFLVTGGLAYTFGVYFYRKDTVKYMHSVWHLFVLAGALLHYFAVQFYVI